jgi:hypothetical protein
MARAIPSIVKRTGREFCAPRSLAHPRWHSRPLLMFLMAFCSAFAVALCHPAFFFLIPADRGLDSSDGLVVSEWILRAWRGLFGPEEPACLH